MAQFETTGGGFIDSSGRKIERKIVVATDEGNLSPPGSSIGGQLTNVAITQEAGGIRRGVYEYTVTGPEALSYSGFFQNGKRVELTGGTREIPIYNHPLFKDLTPKKVQEVQTAVENKTQGPFESEAQTKLFGFLVRGTEYFLSPAVVGRVTEIESRLPRLTPIAKVADPPELSAPSNTFWICTAITATPVGNQYEVTREYTLSFSGWDDVKALYGWS